VLIGIGEATEFPILRVSNLVAWQLTNSACRPVKGVESARGGRSNGTASGAPSCDTVGFADHIAG